MVTFTVEMLEAYLLILARLSAFVYSAPFFSQNSIPRKVKVGFSVILAIVVFQTLDYKAPEYIGVIGFTALVIKELIAGIVIGYSANACMMILAFAGNLMDMEIGFSMVQEMNPLANMQATITGNLYTYLVLMVMLVSDMHLRLLSAIIDTFRIIPIGKVVLPVDFYKIMGDFLVEYFIISFRIVLPVFMCILLTNVVLAILARVAPQMNLFVIGMQLKIIIGLAVLIVTAGLLAGLSDFIFGEMTDMMKTVVETMKG